MTGVLVHLSMEYGSLNSSFSCACKYLKHCPYYKTSIATVVRIISLGLSMSGERDSHTSQIGFPFRTGALGTHMESARLILGSS